MIISVVFFGMYFQYTKSNKIYNESFKEQKYNASLEIREQFRVFFDKLQFQFAQAEAENIKKLHQLYALYESNHNALDLTHIENELNKDVTFGHYEIFLINKDYIIENASLSKEEIGLNLGQVKIIRKLFDNIVQKQIPLDISSPKLDTKSQIKRYLVILSSDEKYILQLAFRIDINKELYNLRDFLNARLSGTDVYVATEFYLQKLFIKPTKDDLKDIFGYHEKNSKIILNELSDSIEKKEHRNLLLADPKSDNLSLNKKLEKVLPLNGKLISHIDKDTNSLNIYSTTGSIAGEKSDLILLLKNSFSLKELEVAKKENLKNFISLFFITLAIVLLFETFRRYQLTLKVMQISKDISEHKKINVRSKFKEITILTENYNAMLCELKERIELNKNLSYFDELTGLRNRKSYNEKIKEHLFLYKRYGNLFSVALIDIDNFKRVNDDYGHSTGDQVLKELANILRINMRNVDYVFRIGGEEFFVLFPNTSLEESKKAMEKIRLEIAKNIKVGDASVTVSIGLTQICENDTQESLFKRVDELLYTSKTNGKNQISNSF